MKRVIIAGASGLIGSELLKLLLSDRRIGEVLALVRSPLSLSHHKLQQISLNFDKLSDMKEKLVGDVLYCCLGTTRKKSPNPNDYRQVDFYYPLELGKIAQENKISQYHLISALGANSSSTLSYNRLKGETEQALKQISLHALHIYQPSLLIGNRTEYRALEKLSINLMAFVNPLLLGKFKKYRSIKAITVAKAMINQTFKQGGGIFTYPSHIIKELA